MKSKVYDLDEIAISLEVLQTWKYQVAKRVVKWYQKTGIKIDPSQIPDEQFRVLENGDGEIFITMPGKIEFSLRVPKGHWAWSNVINN